MDVDNGTNGTVRHDGNSEEGICRYSLRFPARYLARYRRIGDSDGVDDAANSEQDDGIADADDHDNESSFVGNEAALHALTAEILQYVDELCASHNGEGIYIWQREPFSLHPADSATSKYSPKSKTDVAIARLEGSTRTGESVEDEWWIVYLLLEISKKWPDVAIDIHDSDGQFLLIEAADVLPSWITPENAANRVWIRNGSIHLVPLQYFTSSADATHSRSDTSAQITTDDAMKVILTAEIKTIPAYPVVNEAIQARITATLATPHSHHAAALLPVSIAKALEQQPSLISAAVAAFYERDAIQLRKYAQWMRRFPPCPARKTSVKMTRALYAQLRSQRFYPPRVFEKSGWKVDAATEERSLQDKSTDIGVKIAVGFEILYGETSNGNGRVRRTGRDDTIVGGTNAPSARNPAYLRFLVALTNAGYFRGEIAGSKVYTALEEEAERYWEVLQATDSTSSATFAKTVDAISTSADIAGSASHEPSNGKQALRDDDDAWLYIDPAQLERILQAKLGGQSHPDRVDVDSSDAAERKVDLDDEEAQANEQARQLQSMSDQFLHFIDGEGDLEGALLEDEQDNFDDDEDDSDDGLYEDVVAGAPNPANPESRKRKLLNLVEPIAEAEWGAAAAEAAQLLGSRDNSKALPREMKAKTSIATESDVKRMTPRLESEKYDGASDDSDIESEDEEPRRFKAIADSELDEDGLGSDGDQDRIPFAQQDMEEFLNFAREALGLTSTQYDEIVAKRKASGNSTESAGTAPLPVKKRPMSTVQAGKKEDTQNLPTKIHGEVRGKAVRDIAPPFRNAKLDNFEAVMAAMDAEVQKARGSRTAPSSTGIAESSKPTRKSAEGVVIEDDSSDDGADYDPVLAEMEAELAQTLKSDPDDPVNESSIDYGMVKNFLESFQAQAGLPGPVSNLFGRLDSSFSMPNAS